jgi:hypothetical protein
MGQQTRASALALQLRKRDISVIQQFAMNSKSKSPKAPAKETHPSILRGQAAAKLMAKELRAEHKRWNLPLLSWKDGKVVATKP